MGKPIPHTIRCHNNPCNKYKNYNFYSTFPDNEKCCYCAKELRHACYTIYKKHIFCWESSCKTDWRFMFECVY